jgi:hypothetical protein
MKLYLTTLGIFATILLFSWGMTYHGEATAFVLLLLLGLFASFALALGFMPEPKKQATIHVMQGKSNE